MEYCSECEANSLLEHDSDITKLIKPGDILKYKVNKFGYWKIGEVKKYKDARSLKEYLGVEGFGLEQINIFGVLTKEEFNKRKYVVEE